MIRWAGSLLFPLPRTWTARTSPTGTSASSRRILYHFDGDGNGSAVRPRDCLGAVPSLGFFRQGRASRLARKNLHGLDIHHLEQTVPAQLAADAAVLDPAEGHPRIRFHRAVDEDEPRLDLAGQFVRSIQVPRPEARAEAELRIVRLADSALQVRDPEDGRDGAERLLSQDPHLFRHAREQRRFEEPTGPGQAMASDDGLGALRQRILDLAFDLLALTGLDQRTDVRRWVERVADFQVPHSLSELREEVIGDGIHDEETLRGDARLSVVDEPARDGAFRGGVEVRVLGDDEGIGPAEFQDDFLDALGRLARDRDPGWDGAGQADDGDGATDQCGRRCAIAQDDLEDVGRQARLPKRGLEVLLRWGCGARRLDDRGVAC